MVCGLRLGTNVNDWNTSHHILSRSAFQLSMIWFSFESARLPIGAGIEAPGWKTFSS